MKKDIKTAIIITEGLIEAHLKNSKGIRKLIQDWTSETKELGIVIADVHDTVAKCLIEIKKLLEGKPNCKHPKKMRDKLPDGQWYCMNCNSDITITKSKKQ